MVITEIKALKNGRFGLFSGEEFLFSLDADTYAGCGLCAGDEVSGEELERLRALADAQRAKEKALTLLSYRDHTRQELTRKLRRTVGEQQADEAAGRMVELGLVNDEAFARRFACELYERKAYGRARVLHELAQRGVGRALAEQVAGEYDLDPAARAASFLQKKYPRGVAGEAEKRRACAALARCGYSWEEIRRALKKIGMDEQDAD